MGYYRPVLVRAEHADAVERFAADLEAERDTGTDDTLTFKPLP
jgi:hypothetical protein